MGEATADTIERNAFRDTTKASKHSLACVVPIAQQAGVVSDGLLGRDELS